MWGREQRFQFENSDVDIRAQDRAAEGGQAANNLGFRAIN
mgnify:CR=1 FL=1